MSAEHLTLVGNRLIKRCGTRDPFEIAADIGVEVLFCKDFGSLKGMYRVIKRNRLSSSTMIFPDGCNGLCALMSLAMINSTDNSHRIVLFENLCFTICGLSRNTRLILWRLKFCWIMMNYWTISTITVTLLNRLHEPCTQTSILWL